MPITRFAPSPTGYLHRGHIFAASEARRAAGPGGTMLLRIEDIDRTRSRPTFEQAIVEDLGWLGFTWPKPVRRQSEHLADYAAALDRLAALGVIYPCFCTRASLAAIDAPHDGLPVYPGLCRDRGADERAALIATGTPYALRLDAGRALALTGPLDWTDLVAGTYPVGAADLADVVIARKDVGTSYHLAVVCDDAAQSVEIVTRGADLLAATPLHRLLQALLDLPVPVWRHHRLILNEAGMRLAKRDGAETIRSMRRAGMDATAILAAADAA